MIESKEKSFIEQNAKWLLGLVFGAGILYGEFKYVRTIESRLDKKIKIVTLLQDNINELNVKIAVLNEKINNCIN